MTVTVDGIKMTREQRDEYLKIKAGKEKMDQARIAALEVLFENKKKNLIYFFNLPKGKPKYGIPANPLQAQLIEAWERDDKKVFTYTGANRIGKTTIGAIICFSTMFGRWPWNMKPLRFPHDKPRKVRYVGQDWENHIKTVIVPALDKWWPQERKLTTKNNNVGVKAFWQDDKTGSTLEIMSNKQEADSFEGWDGDLVIYDEPPKRDIRVACARGLIDRNGRELFCMTLLKEAWVDREVIKARNEDGTPDDSVFSVDGDIYNNVGFGIERDGIEQFIKTLKAKPEEIQARIHGKPSYLSGLVYPEFIRKTHLKEPFTVPLDWIVDIGIDVHPREPQAALFVATSPQNMRYVIDEIWENGSADWLGDEIVRRVNRNSYRIGRIIIDPLAKGDKNNENTVYERIDNILFRHGMTLEVASKDKSAGILEVRTHLKGPNNEPSIFFFKTLSRTIFEIEGYMWKEGMPVDKDDHMMENLYRILLLNTRWKEWIVANQRPSAGEHAGVQSWMGL